MKNAEKNERSREADTQKFLNYLHENKSVYELCMMKPKKRTADLWEGQVSGKGIVAGWFNNHTKTVKLCGSLDEEEPEGIYVTLNNCSKKTKKRADGELRANVKRTNDSEIVKLENLLVDIDFVRPSGTSTTDKEHKVAIQTAFEVKKYLKEKGWPNPLVVDSGNGAHLIYKIKLENTEHNVHLLRNVLRSLSDEFDTDEIKIDQKVFNPSRLVKIPGDLPPLLVPITVRDSAHFLTILAA